MHAIRIMSYFEENITSGWCTIQILDNTLLARDEFGQFLFFNVVEVFSARKT